MRTGDMPVDYTGIALDYCLEVLLDIRDLLQSKSDISVRKEKE